MRRRRGRPRRLRLTVEEARRIQRMDETGRLDRSDADIRRAVGEANRTVSRSLLWGGDRRDAQRRRVVAVLLIGGLFLLAAVAGFLIPILALAGA